MAKHPKFELFKGKNDQFYFRLTAANGQTILSSQGYTTKQAAQNGISSVKENAAKDRQFARETSSGGLFYFNLLAGNRKIIGSSERYKTTQARDNGIKSVQTNAPKAEIDDLT